MNKLDKHISVILLMLGFSYTAFGQGIGVRIGPNPIRHGHREQYFNHPPNFYNQGGGHVQNFNNRGAIRMQNPGMRKIQVVKENFISRQLSLSPEQGEKFWPLYRQYQNEVFEVRRLKRLNNSDAQANGPEQIKKDLDYESQLVNIRKYYNEEFLKVLPPDKVSELYKSERTFTDELIKQVHEQHSNTPD